MVFYLIRRIIAAVPIVLGVALILFFLFNLVGGDPVYQMVGKNASIAQIEQVRHEYGFDRPIPVQLVQYLKSVATLDFGRSYSTRQRIGDMILQGIGPTLTLSIPAFVLTTLLSVGIAVLVAYFRGGWVDRLVVIFCVIGMSMPILGYILFGQYFLAYKLGWFPISGFDWGWPDRFGYVALPVLIWVAVSLGYDARFFRTALIEETHQDYVRTARAKGVKESVVFLKHVLKNGMIPILTNIVIEVPTLVLGAFLLESFFDIPGLGSITINAVHTSDRPVIMAMGILTSILLIVANIVTDVLYVVVDPRVKLG